MIIIIHNDSESPFLPEISYFATTKKTHQAVPWAPSDVTAEDDTRHVGSSWTE